MSGFHAFKTLVLRRRLMDTERPTHYYYQQLFQRSIPGLENPSVLAGRRPMHWVVRCLYGKITIKTIPYAAFWDVHFLSPCLGAFDPSHDHVLWLRGPGQPGTSNGWEDCHGVVGLLRVDRVGLPGIDWLVGMVRFLEGGSLGGWYG